MKGAESKINFGARQEWAAHRQQHWLDWSGNPSFADYLRVTFVAYGLHGPNGHAKLKQGALARHLVRKDGTVPERRTVWRAVQNAIELGYLDPTSKTLCLVVPNHDVQSGKDGRDEPCPRDHTRREQNVGSQLRRFGPNVGNHPRRSETNVGDEQRRSEDNVVSLQRRSTLSPSLSSPLGSSIGGDADA